MELEQVISVTYAKQEGKVGYAVVLTIPLPESNDSRTALISFHASTTINMVDLDAAERCANYEAVKLFMVMTEHSDRVTRLSTNHTATRSWVKRKFHVGAIAPPPGGVALLANFLS